MSAGKLSRSVSDLRGHCVDTTPLKIKYAITVQKQGVNIYVTKLRKKSWENFLGTINQNTTLHKFWEKVQKIAEKFFATPAPVLRDSDGAISQSHAEVANILVEAFASVSGEHNYSNQFIQYKHNMKSRPILLDTATTYSYNDDFSMQELKHCLSLTTESTPGLDRIT